MRKMIEYAKTEMDYISAKDPVMKELVAHFGHLGGGERKDVFASLISSIVGQMLSNKVADVIDGRLRQLVGDYTPELILQKSVEEIKSCGMSQRKAEYIRGLAQDVEDGKYDFTLLVDMDDEEVVKYLMQIKGVGRWTAEMITEFTLGRLNIFSFDDVALQNGIKKAHGYKTLSKQRFERLRKKYSPFASVASLYYYACNDEK